MLDILHGVWSKFILNILDIAIVTVIIYYLLTTLKGTRGYQVLRGLLILVVGTLLAQFLRLDTLIWLLKGFWLAGVVAVVVVFQPELRKLLAALGEGALIKITSHERHSFVGELIKSMDHLSQQKFGALIVLEQHTGLRNYIETGTQIYGRVTAELICALFMTRSPLHDGAVIIRNNEVVAAGCILPLTHEPGVSRILGTRHRAAIGISEVSDAWALVVSEDTGTISLARTGKIELNVGLQELEKLLIGLFKAKDAATENQAVRENENNA